MKPYPFQKEGVLAIEKFGGRALLADDMGLGKTLQALLFVKRAKLGATLPCIVVCLASVKHSWANMCNTLGLRATVCDGTMVPLIGPLGIQGPNHDVIIINYDILEPWLDWLQAHKPQCLIIDECQGIKTADSLRARLLRQLSRGVPYTIGCSGSPLELAPVELWSILNILHPQKYNTLFGFGSEYSYPRKWRGEWQYKGARNLDKLYEDLRETCMIRRRKKDVIEHLPRKRRRVVALDLPTAKQADYEHAQKDFLQWLWKQNPNRAKRAAKKEAMLKVGYLLRLAAKHKAPQICKRIRQWLVQHPDKKLVVFASQRKMVQGLVSKFSNCAVTINGAVPTNQREYVISQFQYDKNIRLFIGNIDACGTGVDGLQHVCSDAYVVEQPWAPTKVTQLEDRLWRLGQHNTVSITTFIAAGTIEERQCEVLQRRQHIVSRTLDGDLLPDDLNVMDLLLEELLHGNTGKHTA